MDYHKQNAKLFEISDASEVIFKSPVVITKNKNGVTTETPIMRRITKEVPVLNEKGRATGEIQTITTEEPVTFTFWVKDTSSQPPKTILDTYESIFTKVIGGAVGVELINKLGNRRPKIEIPEVEQPEKEVFIISKSSPSGNIIVDQIK